MPDNHKPASQVASKDSSNAFLPGFIKTDGGQTKSNAIQVPGISLPNGGGAIKGIDEKFSVNAVNGTASFSVSLPFSAARGAVPAISLTYNSGSGNGIFGLGWNLGLSSVKRKTNNTLPRYTDTTEPDTFLFADAEDLVPAFKRGADGSFPLDSSGDYIIDQKDSADGLFFIRFYMPRTEGLFARIEQWSNKNSGEIKWRVIAKDNNTTLFGWSAASRISDPKDINRIFEWLPEFVFDNRGNCAHYIYKKEDEKDINPSLLQNKNRIAAGKIKYSNLYIEKILYGNKTPYKKMGDPFPPEVDYLFSNIFDYGEYDPLPPYNKIKDWDFRQDAFSDYKAGFEIRTTRLCKRVLLFHHFKEANEYEGLVKSLDFEYDTTLPAFTFLASITARGYIKKPDGTYSSKNFPAVEFGYQQPDWNTRIKTIAAAAPGRT